MKRVASALALAALLTSSLAHADEAAFLSADVNGDGMLSAEEAGEAFPSISADSFADADLDKDGSVNAEEFASALAAGTIALQ
ncbi:EF-hand domain-containing protein [Pacificispira sp.]|uniref:EF-hand domain-containing protein n=1 Tax=Pacificispira sp. TaxID=2888761 RepID=UPI003BAD1F29